MIIGEPEANQPDDVIDQPNVQKSNEKVNEPPKGEVRGIFDT